MDDDGRHVPNGYRPYGLYRRRNGRGQPDIFGALDLGTNNCRLLIARPSAEGFKVIDAFSRIVRLGEGLATHGRLSEAAMERAIDALKICANKIRRRNVTRLRAIATEACRKAANCAEFVDRVKDATGLHLDIITPGEEAKLAVMGCKALLDQSCDWAIVFDIGGGSTELIWVAIRPDGQPDIRGWTSLPYGVVTLAEKYGGIDVPPELFEKMVAEVHQNLQGFDRGHCVSEQIAKGGVQLLGTSGTVTTLASMMLQLERYDRNQVDGIWMDSQVVHELTRKLANMEHAERAQVPAVGVDRADLIMAGCAILEAISKQWPLERLRVADRGLREGMLVGLMQDRRNRDRNRQPAAPVG